MKKDNTWEFAILKCIKCISSMYREACLPNIYDKIESGRYVNLTVAHLEITEWNQPAYQIQVRSVISNLCKAGYLNHIGEAYSGCYSLTQKGKDRLSGKEAIEKSVREQKEIKEDESIEFI